jgi:hypothetical protein
MKSFFSALKSAIEAMWKKAPAIEVAFASALNNLVPVVEELDVIIDPAMAPELNPILDKIKVGLSALKTTIQGAGTKPNIVSIVDSVNANLGALVATAQIKNPELVAKIQEVASIVTPAINEVAAG